MTLQDLTNNRDRIIKKIQSMMTGDAMARQLMVKPVMKKMVAFITNREEYQSMKPTMANIDKLTVAVTTSWIKHDYKPSSTMTQSEVDSFNQRREDAKWGSISI